MANISDQPGHGDSPAAWTAVVIMLVGVTLGTIALFFNVVSVVYVGAAFIPVGLIVGWVMKRLGFGVNGNRSGSTH